MLLGKPHRQQQRKQACRNNCVVLDAFISTPYSERQQLEITKFGIYLKTFRRLPKAIFSFSR